MSDDFDMARAGGYAFLAVLLYGMIRITSNICLFFQRRSLLDAMDAKGRLMRQCVATADCIFECIEIEPATLDGGGRAAAALFSGVSFQLMPETIDAAAKKMDDMFRLSGDPQTTVRRFVDLSVSMAAFEDGFATFQHATGKMLGGLPEFDQRHYDMLSAVNRLCEAVRARLLREFDDAHEHAEVYGKAIGEYCQDKKSDSDSDTE